jgi:hypothetical protein
LERGDLGGMLFPGFDYIVHDDGGGAFYEFIIP